MSKTKKCSKCNKRKPLRSYYIAKRGKYGVKSYCKVCHSNYGKRWYKNNKEKRSRHRKENREIYNEYQRRWRKNNKERSNEIMMLWRKKNPEKVREYHRKKFHKRRAIKSDNLWSAEIRKEIYKAQGGLCYYSGKRIALNKAQIEHCIPLSKGGTDTLDNKVLVAPDMNSRKYAKLPEQFIAELRSEGIVNKSRTTMDRKLNTVRNRYTVGND